jgi:eukaryotic-like serine/threonine-protein kinase
MSLREPVAGDLLAGRYRLVAPLGRGGMGEVWRAEHLALRSPVAVKLIHALAAQSEESRGRFAREARAAAALRSPHVVQVIDHGVEQGVPFIVMELLEGESLGQRLRRVGILTPAETAKIVTHVARALDKAHSAGIVHRDLKPDNVFLVRNVDEEIAKVLDFGIAKTEAGFGQVEASTRTGAVVGTPHYMSPEQARGTRAVDHRSDVWALGVIAFQCLTGRLPFESEVLGDLLLRICAEPIVVPSSLAHVPPGFDAWFARAAERDPERRFQSAWEAAEALRSLSGLAATGVASASMPPSMSPASHAVPVSYSPASMPSSAVYGVPSGPILVQAPRSASTAGLLLAIVGLLALVGAAAVVAAFLLLRSPEPAPPPVVALPQAPAAEPVASASAASPKPAGARAPRAAASAVAANEAAPDSDAAKKLRDAQLKIQQAQQQVQSAQQQAQQAQQAAQAAEALGK